MNRRSTLLPLALCLMAFRCGGDERPAVAFPQLPELSAETRKPCPPADMATGSLGDLATKDASLAIEYARCQARAATAIGAYDTARQLLGAAEAMAKKAENAAGAGAQR